MSAQCCSMAGQTFATDSQKKFAEREREGRGLREQCPSSKTVSAAVVYINPQSRSPTLNIASSVILHDTFSLFHTHTYKHKTKRL